MLVVLLGKVEHSVLPFCFQFFGVYRWYITVKCILSDFLCIFNVRIRYQKRY